MVDDVTFISKIPGSTLADTKTPEEADKVEKALDEAIKGSEDSGDYESNQNLKKERDDYKKRKAAKQPPKQPSTALGNIFAE